MVIALAVAFAFALLLWVRVQVAVVRARAKPPIGRWARAQHDAVLLHASAARVRRALRSEAHRGVVPGPSGATRVQEGHSPGTR